LTLIVDVGMIKKRLFYSNVDEEKGGQSTRQLIETYSKKWQNVPSKTFLLDQKEVWTS
jgi:hypothetical protein